MKRIFPVIISIIMTSALLFTGCSLGISKLSVKDSVDASVELLTGALEKDRTFTCFTETVADWAEENDIKVETSNEKYLILSKQATETATSKESFVFHAGIDLSSEDITEHSIVAASAVMTSLYSSNNHGDIRGIFTIIENGDPTGASSVSKSYLECDNFIDMTYSADESLCDSISTTSDMQAYKELELSSPIYTEAYKITLTGKTNQSAYKSRGTYPNAIKTIGDLLASCQSSTILFELADFNGGDDTTKLPSQATATIVLHENDVESFIKKFDKSLAKVEEIYEEAEDEEVSLVYTMESVELPSIVISKEDTENIVSLMYTMINGNFIRDEDTDQVMAVSNIGSVSTANGTFTLGINAKSLETSIMDDIHTTVATICGLCDINYREVSTTPEWSNTSGSAMAATLSDTMDLELDCSMENRTASVFVQKNPSLNLIVYGFKHKDLMNGLDAIIDYMAIAGTVLPVTNQ